MAHTQAHSSPQSSHSVPGLTLRPLVLVIDPDESTRSVLEVAMSRDGFDVWSSASASAGLTLLHGRLPDIVVLETDLGEEEGFTFVAQLRGDERLAKIPVLLLAKNADERVEALADIVGADDFLQKPAYARDVVAMARVEMAKRQGGPLVFDSKVLQPLHLTRALLAIPRSGRVLFLNGRAEIRFRTGKILDARFDGHGSSLDTLVRIFALSSGPYELKLEPVEGVAELQCGLPELVETVVPRLQKWSRVLQRSLPLDAHLVVDFARLAQVLKEVPDEVNRVVQLFDGFRSVEQVLIDSSFGETLTLEVSTRLYLMGVLGPMSRQEDEVATLRPMPILFEPRAAEAEELMDQLFPGGLQAHLADAGEDDDQDWYVATQGSGLEVSYPSGGWTTAPVPELLAEGLAPELTRQLDAFNNPMQVEAPQVNPAEAAAQRFADLEPVPAPETGMEASLRLAAEEHSQDRAQERIQTPLMVPRVTIPDLEMTVQPTDTFQSTPASEAGPQKSSSSLNSPEREAALKDQKDSQAQLEAPSQATVISRRSAASTPAPQKASSTVSPVVIEAFFKDGQKEEEEAPPEVETKKRRRIWPFVLGGLCVLGLALLIDSLRSPATGRTPEQPPLIVESPTPVVAPPLPDIEPAPFIPTEAEEPVANIVDTTENLAEARKAYEGGQIQKTLTVLDQVLSDDPNSVGAWNLVALARYDSGDAVQARAAALKVLELEPQNAQVQMLLATLHFAAKERELGCGALQKYLELEPNGQQAKEARALLKRHRC